METLHLSSPNGKPRGKNVYRARQTDRPGWRPRQVSDRKLASHIAISIQARIDEQRTWSWAEYGIDDEPHMIGMVLSHLPTKTPAEIAALKAGWLDDPCFPLEDTDGFEVHRAELLEFRLTHTAWAYAQAHAPLKCDAWAWRVSEADAARIEAKKLVAHYLGWAGQPLDGNDAQIETLAQTLVDAATAKQ